MENSKVDTYFIYPAFRSFVRIEEYISSFFYIRKKNTKEQNTPVFNTFDTGEILLYGKNSKCDKRIELKTTLKEVILIR